MTAIILPFPSSSALAPSPVRVHQVDDGRIGRDEAATSEAGSVARCVDWLLDRQQSTTDPVLVRLVGDVLTDVARLGDAGRCEHLTDVVVGALASVEAAFEITASTRDRQAGQA